MKKIFLTIFLIILICATSVVYATTPNEEIQWNVISNVNVNDMIYSEQENTEETQNVSTTNEHNFYDSLRDELKREQIVYDDFYLMDEKVTINQNIYGNMYVIAEEINLESIIIDGNVFLIAENVNLNNVTIYGSAYIIAKDFECKALISDLYLLGEELNIQEESYINRSARICGESIDLKGEIKHNCYLFSDNITVTKDAKIGGTLSYYSSKGANIDSEENIGNIEFHQKKVNEEEIEDTFTAMDAIYGLLSSAIKVAVIAGAWILLSSKVIKVNKNMTMVEFFKSLGIGMFIFFIVPIVAMMLLISIVGTGIGLIIFAIYAILLYISTIVACLALASKIVKSDSKWAVWGATVGIYLAIQLFTMVTGFGIVISMLLGLAGLGFILRNIWYKENEK